MKKIFSKVNKDLLHMVYDTNHIETSRIDLIESENFIQCALVKNSEVGYKYRPHFHNINKVDYKKTQTQETWFVLNGSIKVYHYDINGELLNTEILKKGSLNITLKGGHTLEILEKNTIIMEHKNGPYFGFDKDKTLL
jgi:cupin fold WbuC family metalloprotein